MRTIIALFIVAGLVVAAPAPPSASDKVAGLIKQLAASDAREREAAQKALEEIGQPAIEPLKKAALTGNAEFARLATTLAEKIRLATDTSSAFAPTIVELNLKDTPLPDAVAALAKASGYPIRLADADKLKDRKITLATGKVPFWKAVDELCKQGKVMLVDGIIIRDSVVAPIGGGVGGVIRPGVIAPVIRPGVIRIQPKAKIDDKEKPAEDKPKDEKKDDKKDPPAEKPNDDKPVVQPAPKAARAPAVAIQAQAQFPAIAPLPPTQTANREIVVVDQVATMPSSIAGAFMVRGVSFDKLTKAQQRLNDIALQVMGEPKFASFTVTDVKITKAIDDQDQVRQLTSRSKAKTTITPKYSSFSRPGAPPTATYPIALTEGEKEAKMIKELSGSVTVQIRSAASDVAVLRELEKKKSVRTTAGVSIQLNEFEKNADGTYSVQADISFPAGTVVPELARDAIAPLPLPAPGVARPAVMPINTSGLRLTDKNGQAFALTNVRTTMTQSTYVNEAMLSLVGGLLPTAELNRLGSRMVYQVTATFATPPGSDAAPSQLLFRGSQVKTIDVPFQLQNLPLK